MLSCSSLGASLRAAVDTSWSCFELEIITFPTHNGICGGSVLSCSYLSLMGVTLCAAATRRLGIMSDLVQLVTTLEFGGALEN